MKRKILLLMLTLGFLGYINAQTPRMLDNGFHLMSSPLKFQAKPIGTQKSPMSGKQRQNIERTRFTSQSIATQPTFQVDFTLNYDESTQKPWSIMMFGQHTYVSSLIQGIELTKESNLLDVPADCYDIFVTYWLLDTTQEYETPLYELLVIRENITLVSH